VTCSSAIYDDKPSARDAQHRIQRMYHFATNIRFCEDCDGFHLNANLGRLKLPKRAIEIMTLTGQGFTRNEIAQNLGISKDSVRWYYRVCQERFGAMSIAHLMCIAIAVNALSPNSFVPQIIERKHDARENGKFNRARGNLATVVRGGDGKDTNRIK
jgi:DNA-binding CsgD family transcriptional regulator